jgi:hypothetical protein
MLDAIVLFTGKLLSDAGKGSRRLDFLQVLGTIIFPSGANLRFVVHARF